MARNYWDNDYDDNRRSNGRGEEKQFSQKDALKDLNREMEKATSALERSAKESDDENTKPEKKVKILFGIFDVPQSVASMYDMLYNTAQPYVRSFVEQGVEKHGGKMFGGADNARRVGSGVGWAFTLATPITGGIQTYFSRVNEYKDLAERLKPVVEALGKRPTAGNLSILGDNAVLQAEYARIGQHTRQNIMTDVVASGVAAIPQVALKVYDDKNRNPLQHVDEAPKKKWGQSNADFEKELWKYKEQQNAQVAKRVKEFAVEQRAKGVIISEYQQQQMIDKELGYNRSNHYDHSNNGNESDTVLKGLVASLGGFGAAFVKHTFATDRKNDPLRKTALDKIIELRDELDNKGDGLGTDEIATRVQDIFNTLQLNKGQREVREVDREDFERACRQIAESVANFELDPMGLVLLAGGRSDNKERMILKHHGKQIATFDETEAAIKQIAELMPARGHTDPHKFEQESAITAEKQKEIVTGLPAGHIKDFYIAELPQTVAKVHGIEDKEYIEIKQRARPTQDATRRLALLDLLVMPDDVLKAMNFKEEQIAKIREIGEEAIDDGSKPVKDAMSKAKLDGIEMLILGAGSYWDKFVSGELKEIGQLWRQHSPKYLEEREAKRESEAESRRHEEEEERKSAKDKDHGDSHEDHDNREHEDHHKEEGDEKPSRKSTSKEDDLEQDEIKDERFPKTRKKADRGEEREDDLDLEEEKPRGDKKKIPSTLLAKGKARDLDSGLGEGASRDI